MPAASVKVSCLETWPVSLHHGQFIYMFKCVLSCTPNASHMPSVFFLTYFAFHLVFQLGCLQDELS